MLSNRKAFYRTSITCMCRFLTSKSSMNVQTFVFLDTETTGLPSQDGNRTKITELCLTVVQSDHIKSGVLPRVLSKLILCFNPLKTIDPIAREITGLTNELLKYQSEFKQDTVSIIKSFLSLQRQPVCIVAHNGNGFDYPILRAEIHNVGSELPVDVLCIDSLHTFRELDRPIQMEVEDIHNLPTQRLVPPEFCDGYDELLFNLVEEVEASEQSNHMQQINETTPRKNKNLIGTDYFHNSGQSGSNINNAYYIPKESETDTSPPSTKGSRQGVAKKQIIIARQSYKLVDVYKRLTKKEITESHRAEVDCSMLIECAAVLGQQFTDWANTNAKKFSDIPMMQPGQKLRF